MPSPALPTRDATAQPPDEATPVLTLASPDEVEAAQGLAFFQACAQLIARSGEAAKAGLPELQALEMSARRLLPAAQVVPGGWAVAFAGGIQRALSAGLRVTRGNQLAAEWRHRRAKEEYAASAAEMRESIALIASTLPEIATWPALADSVPALGQYLAVQRALLPLVLALEQQCDGELLLLGGRTAEYSAAMRQLAGEARRSAEGMLDSGADASEIDATCRQLLSLADTLLARADAVEQLQAQRPLYAAPQGDRVFIINGHAEDKWRELRDLLEDRLGLKGRVVVLKEEVSQGQTVIEKFERHARQCGYAFALLTPDDAVTKADAKGGSYQQARPNVLFEAGWFYGRLGPTRLCLLKRSGTAVPSDLAGVIAIDFAEQVREGFVEIQDALRAAGVI